MNQDLERETSRSCRGSLMLIATAASLGSTSGDSSGASFFFSRAEPGNASQLESSVVNDARRPRNFGVRQKFLAS